MIYFFVAPPDFFLFEELGSDPNVWQWYWRKQFRARIEHRWILHFEQYENIVRLQLLYLHRVPLFFWSKTTKCSWLSISPSIRILFRRFFAGVSMSASAPISSFFSPATNYNEKKQLVLKNNENFWFFATIYPIKCNPIHPSAEPLNKTNMNSNSVSVVLVRHRMRYLSSFGYFSSITTIPNSRILNFQKISEIFKIFLDVVSQRHIKWLKPFMYLYSFDYHMISINSFRRRERSLLKTVITWNTQIETHNVSIGKIIVSKS